MKTLIIMLMLAVTLSAQSFEIVKEKTEGSGMNSRSIILVRSDSTYYLGVGVGSYPMSRTLAIQNAEFKIKHTPSDSLTVAQRKHLFR